MRPPGFWSRPPAHPGVLARLLAPAAAVYAAATAQRVSRKPRHRASVPVICIGNLNIGGTGKTPTTIALAEKLTANGCAPHVVSRGYGAKLTGPLRVEERKHSAADVGDEPLLLAAFAPTWIARDRAAGVRAAEAAGAGVVLMDDGFQNSSVVKNLSIVVVDAEFGFGNGRVIPAGPLREPVKPGLLRADLVLTIGTPDVQASFAKKWGTVIPCTHVRGTLMPLPTGMDWRGLKVLAFAGIGHPDKFFATLRSLGVNLLRSEALDDHQPLSDALMTRLELEAKALNAQLVTTEKDAVRLPARFRPKVLTLPVRLILDSWSELDRALAGLGLDVSADGS